MSFLGDARLPLLDDPLTQVLIDWDPEPIVVLTAHGHFVSANTAFTAMFGDQPSLDGSMNLSCLEASDSQRIAAAVRRAGQGDPETIRVDVAGGDSAGRPLQVTIQPVATDDGTRVVVHLRPWPRENRRNAAVRLDDRGFRRLFEGAGVGVVIADRDGRFMDANRACLDMLGYTLDEWRQLDIDVITHPDDRRVTQEPIHALLSGHIPFFAINKRYMTRDGNVVWGYTTVSTLRNDQGEITHLAAMLEDVTSVVEARLELERSEGLQHLAGELARVGGWAVEGPERTQYWSRSMYGILDVPAGKGLAFAQAISLYAPGHRERAEAAVDACFEDGTPFDLELEVHTYTGRRIPVRAIGQAQRDDEGQIVGVRGAFQDISDLRAAAARAEHAARHLESSLESMSDGLLTLDREWRFSFLNERAAELLQRSREDLIGKNVWDEFPEAVDTDVFHAYRRAVEQGTTQVIEEYCYPPLDTWFAVHAYPSEAGLAVYFRDITASRKRRIDLEARDAQTLWQAALLNKAQDAILVGNLDHTITFWNRAAERIYGWPADAAIGTSIRDLLYDDPAEFDQATQAVLDTGEWSGRLTQRSAAGEQVVAACRWSLLHDEDGNPDAVLAINTDITQWHGIEQQLLRAQRMESIGTLAGGVAHDLNNVLAPIMLASDLIREHADDPQTHELADIITTSATRGTDLVTQVLYFARGVEGQRLPVDVATLLRDIAGMVGDTFPKNIDLAMDLPVHEAAVLGDSTQLQQILLNLAINARDAMPHGGTLSIRAFEVELDAQYVAAESEAAAGDYVVIEVEDTGTGMPPEVRDRIFEPFFTTKPHGAGTGLGLSTSRGIVTSHGGFIRVYSQPGHGTRFRVHLPLDTQMEPDNDAPQVAGPLPQGNGETVLVVDDEPLMRTITCQTLEANGYECLNAENGAQAVALFAQHRGQIAAVIVDMMMPVMDGPATIHALQTMAPDLTIIGSSGFHGDGKSAEAVRAGVRGFLPKPYTARALLETLAGALDTDVSQAF